MRERPIIFGPPMVRALLALTKTQTRRVAKGLPESINPASVAYARLWESIHGAGAWAKNPWVWVVEFEKL